MGLEGGYCQNKGERDHHHRCCRYHHYQIQHAEIMDAE